MHESDHANGSGHIPALSAGNTAMINNFIPLSMAEKMEFIFDHKDHAYLVSRYGFGRLFFIGYDSWETVSDCIAELDNTKDTYAWILSISTLNDNANFDQFKKDFCDTAL